MFYIPLYMVVRQFVYVEPGMCLYVRARVYVCMHASVCACASVCARVCLCVCGKY